MVSGLLIRDFGIGAARNIDEPVSPGEGTRPTGIPVVVGPVPSPGVSLNFREIGKLEAADVIVDLTL